MDCVYLNDGGDSIESIDANSDTGECSTNGGYWIDGTLAFIAFDSSSNFVSMIGVTGSVDNPVYSAWTPVCNGTCMNQEPSADLVFFEALPILRPNLPSPQTPGFTLSVTQPGQSFSACMAANSGNYSISGVFFGGKGQLFAGNDIANLGFGNTGEGTAGLFFSEGGSKAFTAGVGTAMTAGRRTASITSLNLEGVTGRAPMILGKTGAEEIAGWLSFLAELKSAADAGLTGAEAIGCAIH